MCSWTTQRREPRSSSPVPPTPPRPGHVGLAVARPRAARRDRARRHHLLLGRAGLRRLRRARAWTSCRGTCGAAAASWASPRRPSCAAAFGVFEPGLIAALYDAGRAACSLADVRAAKESGAVAALREVLGTPDGLGPDGLDTAVEQLRRGAAAADSTGRPLHAGLTALQLAGRPAGPVVARLHDPARAPGRLAPGGLRGARADRAGGERPHRAAGRVGAAVATRRAGAGRRRRWTPRPRC